MDLLKEPENEFKVGWCPICNQGWQVIVKDTDTEKLFIMCEECLSLWDHPLNIKMGKKALDKIIGLMRSSPHIGKLRERDGCDIW